MKKLISSILQRLQIGECVVLCSILASSGSAPRGTGAKMAIFSDGSTVGTIGGGAVERAATEQARIVLQSGETLLKAYQLNTNQVNDIGMICGGAVTVYFQRFSPDDMTARETLEKMSQLLKEDENAWLLTEIKDGEVTQFCVYRENEIPETKKELFSTRAQLSGKESLYYTEPIVRRGAVYIFGGGHVGRALVPVLAGVDFRVTVFDNRESFAQPENFFGAQCVVFGDYKKITEKVSIRPQDYVVIMTPGHQADFEVLEQVLRIPPAYVGCIGSRTKIRRTNEKLQVAGFSQEEIDSIHAPIGIDILAQTPEEIAISIAAELIRCRRERL